MSELISHDEKLKLGFSLSSDGTYHQDNNDIYFLANNMMVTTYLRHPDGTQREYLATWNNYKYLNLSINFLQGME